MTNGKYEKECILVGDLSRKQDTIDYWFNHINAKIYRSVQSLFKGRVCDVGSNIGMMTLLCAKSDNVSFVCGVDVFDKAATHARQYAEFLGLLAKVDFMTFNFAADEIPLEEASFDGVVTFHTLEHIFSEDLDTFVGNMYRILVPGGYALVSLPYERNFGSNEHVSFFDECPFISLFKRNKFTVSGIWLCDAFNVFPPVKHPTILSGLFVKEERNG